MNKDKRLTILIILIVTLSLIGIGIAFAAFSQTLTINGSAEVEASSWQVVFEGMTNVNAIDAPTTSGTAAEVTHPTIKNNSTEISTYSVSLKTPGDSITYNFKIHNKGDFAANLSSFTISGVNRPASPVTGSALVTDSSIATANANTLNVIEYKFYYTDNNALVGQDPRDCLEPGETENVSLRIVFASTDTTDTEVLPSSDLVLDNLGVSATYNQYSNGYCTYEQGDSRESVTDAPFDNFDGAYYTYEGKSFVGTGVDNIIITEKIVSTSRFSRAYATICSDGSEPVNYVCSGSTPSYEPEDRNAAISASGYCTGCRLMKSIEVCRWVGASNLTCRNKTYSKLIATYQGNNNYYWWLDEPSDCRGAWAVNQSGKLFANNISIGYGIRPVTDIPSTATMSGSGTKLAPYVITVN